MANLLDLRPRLIHLWRFYLFRSDTLAELAKVPESTILLMFRYEEVERPVAEKVLAALSSMLGGKYTLDTVKVELTRKNAGTPQSTYPSGRYTKEPKCLDFCASE